MTNRSSIMSSLTVLFDGDVLLYKAGFAVERRVYHVGDHCPPSLPAARKVSKLTGYPIIRKKYVRPAHIAVGCLQSTINYTLKRVGTDKCIMMLSDPVKERIYRHAIYPEYKANREGLAKPVHIQPLRKYMTDNYSCEIREGYEADDVLGIRLMENPNYVCASVDKDLWMIPGKHIDINTGKKLIASDPGDIWLEQLGSGKKLRGHGELWFWAQMCMGDRVDNIPGIPRMGDVTTYKFIKDLTPSNLESSIKNLYDKHNMDFELNRKLLWIWREEVQQ